MKLRLKDIGFISTGCPNLDKALDGGFKYGTMSHFYGKDGSGKTTLGYQLSIIVLQQGYDVVWIDLNGNFSIKRLLQMNYQIKNYISNFKLAKIETYKKLKNFYQNIDLYLTNNTRLIVIDPITYYYRLYSGVNAEFSLRRELFNHQLPILARITLDYDLHIILINQARGSYEDDFVAVTEKEVSKYSKYVFRFEKDEDETKRIITIKKLFKEKPETKLSCSLSKYGISGCELC